jgi:hypothetical protein
MLAAVTLVVDFMHEFKLGVWKGLFVHLIWILYAAAPGGKLVATLDKRYVQNFRMCRARSHRSHISQILADTLIQPHSHTQIYSTNNVSELKKLAAWDYEDILQCSIPAFEDLLDEPHNKQLMKLLYQTAEWHAFAKLRMHTDTMLEHLRHLTKEFGSLMRQFRDQTCS